MSLIKVPTLNLPLTPLHIFVNVLCESLYHAKSVHNHHSRMNDPQRSNAIPRMFECLIKM